MAIVTQRLLPPCEYAVRSDCHSLLNTDPNAGNNVVDSATLCTSGMADMYVTCSLHSELVSQSTWILQDSYRFVGLLERSTNRLS